MIGLETLYDRLLLEQSPPTLQSDFHELFISVKHSPSHISSFNSKIFHSALLSDETYPVALSKLLANVWLQCHGFTATLSIKLSDYLTAVGDFQLEKYFVAELRSLPDVLFEEVSNRILQIVINNKAFVKLVPYILEVDTLKCKTGIGSGDISIKCLENATQRLDSLDEPSVTKLVQHVSEISYMVCYTGTGTIIRKTSESCDIIDKVSSQDISSVFDQIHPSDSVLAELHTGSKSTCCHFEVLTNLNTHFTHLAPVHDAGKMFLDSLSVHSVCDDEPKKLVQLYSLSKHLLSDQLSRAFYTPEHVEYLENLVESVPEESSEIIMSSPIYKALNFDPVTAEWEELVTQVRNGLSKSNESFDVMMSTPDLELSMIEDCISLVNVLTTSQLALMFSRTFGANNSIIPLQQKILVIRNIIDTIKTSSVKNLSSFSKTLYNECGFSFSQLDQFSPETKDGILGDHGNVTKTINQLGSKGAGKWKEKLYHSLLINFTLMPDQLLRSLIGQATRNKALSSSVAVFLKDLLPFTLNPLIPASEVVFLSLKTEFQLLKTLKEVKQFDGFIETLKPLLSHQTILKLLLLPLIKSCQDNQFTTLTWLQLYLQREPFYNFSLFYELVRIWATPDLDGNCSELLDDGDILDDLSAQIMDYPKEAYLMLKMVTQGWGWKAGLRFSSIMEEPKIKLPKMVGDLDLSVHVFMDCLSFVEGDFRDERGELSASIALCLLQLAKYSSSSLKFKLSNLNQTSITDSVFTQFSKVSTRSLREWENVYRFLDECFSEDTLNLTHFLVNRGEICDLTAAIKKSADVCEGIDLNYLPYFTNDVLTFIVLSAVSGNTTALRWFGKVCETFNNSTTGAETDADEKFEAEDIHVRVTQDGPTNNTQNPQEKTSTRSFILVCVLLKLLQSQSLETLLLSMAPHVNITSGDAKKALALLPASLQSTLSIKMVSSNE